MEGVEVICNLITANIEFERYDWHAAYDGTLVLDG